MEEIIQEALSKGVKMHVAGEFDLASKLYSSVMKLQPEHADANHNMGLLKIEMADFQKHTIIFLLDTSMMCPAISA